MSNIVKIDTVHKYNELMGVETLHPLVSVVNMSKCKPIHSIRANYGLYCIFLKDVSCGVLRYGMNTYDYQEGTIVAVSPGQLFGSESKELIQPSGLALVFHPDLIYGTELGRTIREYQFFSYDSNEALHLSERERTVIEECFHNIKNEIERDIDKHTNRVISRSIALLLDYCLRFYDRQFITRHKSNSDILTRFEQMLDEYINSDKPLTEGLPAVSYFADKLCLSANYFGDLIKKETGKSPLEHIQLRLIDMAKQSLTGTNKTISMIAEELGFKYPTHFTRLFKKTVGISPMEYRMSC